MRFIFNILLLFAIVFAAEAQLVAIKGKMELDKFQFENQQTLKLNGEWEFYWNKFYTAADFENRTVTDSVRYINVPNYWNGYMLNGKELTGNGYATYRLVLKPVKRNELYAIKMLTVSTAYELYVNGCKIINEGTIGTSKTEMVAAYRPVTVSFVSDTTQLEILMHVSNYNHRAGGPWQEIELGKATDIVKKSNQSLAMELFLMGSIIIMALYHFGLYLIRRKEKSPLFFGLFSLVMAIRVAVTGEYGANLLYNWQWETLVFFEYFTFYSAILVFPMYIYTIFSSDFSKKVLYILLGIYLVFCSFLFFSPPSFYSLTIIYFYPFVGLLAVYIFYSLFNSLRNRRDGARVFLSGFIILFATTINDVLHQNDIIHTFNMSSLGIFGFIFVQAFLLSKRFSNAFFKTEKLSVQLDYMNRNLENTVLERTSEIQMQKEELQVQAENLSIIVKEVTAQRDIIERSHNRIKESINYAKRIQDVIMPNTECLARNQIEHFVLFKPRDVVSGDFYWMQQVTDDNNMPILLIAVADCTGHGVPGALMSMLGITFLNEIVLQHKIVSPAKILTELRLKIKSALQQKGNFNETADGMDIALCKIDLTNRIILYSGAYSSLIKVSFSAENSNNRVISTYSGIKTPIGIYLNEKEFFNTAIQFQPNDVFYMFSDGYMDQFGGTNGRKFLKKNFKDLLYTISPESMEKQKELLETTFAAWRNNRYEQIDDILVVGLRLN